MGVQAQKLRELLVQPGAIVVPGVYDALTAKLVEEAGYPVVFCTGAGLSNAQLGMADLGFVTATENRWVVERMATAVQIPLIADVDTGYGGPLQARRTAQDFERVGVAAVQIEDQVMPKKCGHFTGKAVVSKDEMVQKIRAIREACPDLVIIARTDARAVNGLADAIDRAQACVEAGADGTFIEAPQSIEELATIGREMRGVPQVANMVDGGHTPIVPLVQLGEMGFKVVLYANVVLRSAVLAIQGTLRQLKQDGDSHHIVDRLLPWEERQRIVGLGTWEALDARYRV